MDQLILAYLAGLFDGEGNANVLSNKRKYYPQAKKKMRAPCLVPYLQLKLTDVEPVQLLHSTFGGAYGEYDRPAPYKSVAYWRVSHQKALQAAKALIPYTRIKTNQLQRVIDHYEGGK